MFRFSALVVYLFCLRSLQGLPKTSSNNTRPVGVATSDRLFPWLFESNHTIDNVETTILPLPSSESGSSSAFITTTSSEPVRHGGRRPCDIEHLEYRLTKLEVQVAEKSEHLRSEMRENNRRLQSLEFQSAEVQTALETFRNEIERFSEIGRPLRYTHETSGEQDEKVDKLEMRVDSLGRGIQLVVAALRGINYDITWIKRNVSSIVNSTDNLLQVYDNLVTKQFLANSMVDVKHHQLMTGYRIRAKSEDCCKLPRNCKEVQQQGNNATGIYRIHPETSPRPFMVVCDMDTRGGGWTLIHNRFEGSQDFYLNWLDYKHGFGNLGGEFWLGLEKINHLTDYYVNELLVELGDGDMKRASAHYSAFSIGSEAEGYSLKVLGGYTGDAGDSLMYHAGSRFSTKDMDQDAWREGSCAQSHGGAWWYRGCDTSNLNGRYIQGELSEDLIYQGMYWGEFHGPRYSLSQARMMIRPRDEESSPLFPGGITGNRRN